MSGRPQGLLALLCALLATATPLSTQPTCASGGEVDLTVGSSVNASGHRRVSARLGQPLGAGGWQLRLQLRTTTTASGDGGSEGGPHRQWLVLTLDGPPAAPSPSPSSTPGLAPPAAPSPSPSSTPGLAPPGYTTLPGLGHYRQPPEARDWYNARRLCRAEGGALLVPTSRREVSLLFQLFFPPNATGAVVQDRLWLGAGDFEHEGQFVTDDGVPIEDIGYAEFHPGQPDGKTAENCLALYKSGLLVDVSCSISLTFICKVPL